MHLEETLHLSRETNQVVWHANAVIDGVARVDRDIGSDWTAGDYLGWTFVVGASNSLVTKQNVAGKLYGDIWTAPIARLRNLDCAIFVVY